MQQNITKQQQRKVIIFGVLACITLCVASVLLGLKAAKSPNATGVIWSGGYHIAYMLAWLLLFMFPLSFIPVIAKPRLFYVPIIWWLLPFIVLTKMAPGSTLYVAEKFPYLLQQAHSGDVLAAYQVGEYYYFGWGNVKKNYVEAIRWYRLSSKDEPGAEHIAYRLGNIYCYGGYGVEPDETKCVALLRRAAEHYDCAVVELGDYYYTKHDYRKAFSLYNEAYQYNYGGFGVLNKIHAIYLHGGITDADAEFYEAERYRHGAWLKPKMMIDEPAALEHYKVSANLDNIYAQKKLADIYERGLLGVTKDHDEAMKWQRLADKNVLVYPQQIFTKYPRQSCGYPKNYESRG